MASNDNASGRAVMQLTGNEDLRVQKTIDGIRASFDELLCEKEYGKITVKELCERARINRKTFYRYYETLDDLLAETMDDFANSWISHSSELNMYDDAEQIAYVYCLYSASQPDVYDQINNDSRNRGLRDELLERVRKSRAIGVEALTSEDDAELNLALAFIRQSMLAVYRQWLNDGKKVPPERMAEIAKILVGEGMAGFRRETETTFVEEREAADPDSR